MPQDGTPVIGVYPRLPPVGPIRAVISLTPINRLGSHGFGAFASLILYKDDSQSWSL